MPQSSVDLFNGRPTAATATRHAAPWHATARHVTPTSRLVNFHHDRIHDTLDLLLLRLKFIFLGHLVLVEPIECILDSLLDIFLVSCFKLILQFLLLESITHGKAIVFKA